MRVAVVVRSLKIGGMERAAVNLAEAFAAQGHEAHLIFFKDKNRELFPREAVQVHHFALEKAMRRNAAGLGWELFSRLMNGIIRRSYFYWSGFYLSRLFAARLEQLEQQSGPFDLIIARGQGTFETLWNFHDPRFVQVVESMFLFPGKALQNFYLRRIYDRENIVCVSRGVEQQFMKTAGLAGFAPHSVHLITNPMDPEHVFGLSQRYEPDIDAPYILSVGRITPNKNLSLLIDAYLLFRQTAENPPLLVIVGDGHDRAAVEAKIARLGAEPYIKMLGKKENPYPWMRRAELFVLSSKFEGLGMVLIEAMACRTKVVATKAPGGVFDIMTGELQAYLADLTPEALAQKIAFALERPAPDYRVTLDAFRPETIVQRFSALSSERASKT
jgi:glycosyltransferase involved in cell wall biosynthesis